MTRDEAERLLYREARLLDDRCFDEWLTMFAPECSYWIPTVDGDPSREPSLINDDHARLRERVYRLQQPRAYAQDPPSRTQHQISNVEIVETTESGEALVLCNLLLVELRPGGDLQIGLNVSRLVAARCEYRFVGGPAWLIARKKVSLIDRDLPHYNLSFLI